MSPRRLDPPRAVVALAGGATARAARFARAHAARRRTPREDFASSAARAAGGAGEFAGRRRYRPGDDVRAFDWEALARGAEPLVRLSSRDAAERWCVLLDTSASMAVGAPPKVQLAAELALAACALGLERGHEVRLATARGVATLRGRRDLARAAAELDGLACAGSSGFGAAPARGELARATRWILVGDLLGADPIGPIGPFGPSGPSGPTGDGGVARLPRSLAGRVRRIDAFAVLAEDELAPRASLPGGALVEWHDPESGAALAVALGERETAAYASALAQHLGRWRSALARARGELVVARAGEPFEPCLRRWLAAGDP